MFVAKDRDYLKDAKEFINILKKFQQNHLRKVGGYIFLS